MGHITCALKTGPNAEALTELKLLYVDGRTWTLAAPFGYLASDGRMIVVPLGFRTDFNSIPRGLWNILPPTDYAQAGVIHDYLYRHNGVTRKQADQLHREILVLLGAPVWKRLAMYRALRLFGWVTWRKYRQTA